MQSIKNTRVKFSLGGRSRKKKVLIPSLIVPALIKEAVTVAAKARIKSVYSGESPDQGSW